MSKFTLLDKVFGTPELVKQVYGKQNSQKFELDKKPRIPIPEKPTGLMFQKPRQPDLGKSLIKKSVDKVNNKVSQDISQIKSDEQKAKTGFGFLKDKMNQDISKIKENNQKAKQGIEKIKSRASQDLSSIKEKEQKDRQKAKEGLSQLKKKASQDFSAVKANEQKARENMNKLTNKASQDFSKIGTRASQDFSKINKKLEEKGVNQKIEKLADKSLDTISRKSEEYKIAQKAEAIGDRTVSIVGDSVQRNIPQRYQNLSQLYNTKPEQSGGYPKGYRLKKLNEIVQLNDPKLFYKRGECTSDEVCNKRIWMISAYGYVDDLDPDTPVNELTLITETEDPDLPIGKFANIKPKDSAMKAYTYMCKRIKNQYLEIHGKKLDKCPAMLIQLREHDRMYINTKTDGELRIYHYYIKQENIKGGKKKVVNRHDGRTRIYSYTSNPVPIFNVRVKNKVVRLQTINEAIEKAKVKRKDSRKRMIAQDEYSTPKRSASKSPKRSASKSPKRSASKSPNCDKWLENKLINPATGRKIKANSAVYKKLESMCM